MVLNDGVFKFKRPKCYKTKIFDNNVIVITMESSSGNKQKGPGGWIKVESLWESVFIMKGL